MFERYNESARRVLFLARLEASQVGSMSIETEHLLTGLLREGKGIAGRLLSTPPLSPDAIRLGLQRRVQVRDPLSTSVEIPFSEETKRVLVHAVDEADSFRSRDIGPEHLLLGILREERSLAAAVLLQLGARIAPLRDAIATNKDAPPTPESVRAAELREALAHLTMMIQDVAQGETLAERTRRAREISVHIERLAEHFLP